MLVFPAGSGLETTRDCAIAINDDNEIEGMESIDLVADVFDDLALFLEVENRVTVNIIDDDGS